MTAYAAGLRLSEVIGLRVDDLEHANVCRLRSPGNEIPDAVDHPFYVILRAAECHGNVGRVVSHAAPDSYLLAVRGRVNARRAKVSRLSYG